MGNNDRASLEAFVVGNQDLEQLENLLSEFNIFEAVGAVRQELRHSDFLAFLLNPMQNHGLDDVFLKRLLKLVLIGVPNAPLSAVDIDVADMRHAEVRREWKRIDILVHDPANRLVCVIENKIGAQEHSNQLQRYRQTVAQAFPDCRGIFIYLTPEGDEPSDENYLSFSYARIAELLDDIRQAHQSTLGADVNTLLSHYTTMLRRHVVSDSEIAELCRKIYRGHKQALDLIFEHRPDLQMELADILNQLISESSFDKKKGSTHKHYIVFYDSHWKALYKQIKKKGWKISYHPLYLQFNNTADSLTLVVGINKNPDSVRQVIHQFVQPQRNVFERASRKLGHWPVIYKKTFLTNSDYEDADLETLTPKIEKAWEKFLSQDYPAIQDALAQLEWPDPPKS